MVTKLVVLIFASFFIQDAVSTERTPSDAARAHDDRAAFKTSLNNADQQNSGKIWNWTFGNAPPATNEGTLKTPPENAFLAEEGRAFDEKKSRPSKLSDNNALAADFKESFLKKSHDPKIDARYSVPNRNLAKLRNQFHNKPHRKYESEEYEFDESDDDESDSDSQSGSSQSYDDDDDDLSPENKYPKGYEFSPNTRMRGQHQYPMPLSQSATEQPAMQTRSLQMQPLRGHARRFGSVSM